MPTLFLARGEFSRHPLRHGNSITYLTVTCRMPRRVVLESLEHVLGIPLSLGSVQKVWEEASEAVAVPYEELGRQLPQEPVLSSDETVDHWRRSMHTLSWIS